MHTGVRGSAPVVKTTLIMKKIYTLVLPQGNARKLHKLAFVFAAIIVLTGCSTVGYYSQIVSGHMRIVFGKRPVAEIVSDDSVNDVIKHRLQVAQNARQFAIQDLGLPDNESYTSFYDTGRRFVTWNVVAAEEFSFNPVAWCFPIAGCVSYRGYYELQDATAYAQDLAKQGLDVSVNGATAYSTLGWFKDPILNTMLARSDPAIASLLFHELAHQQLYVGDDSTFNESFATFVEKEGLRQWRKNVEETNPTPLDSKIAEELAARDQREIEFVALLNTVKEDLEVLYELPIGEDEMRSRKSARFEQMRDEYDALKDSWGGYTGYDDWMKRDLNNARLVAVGTYNDYIPAFEEMFRQNDSSLEKFYVAALEVSKMPAPERTKLMEELLYKASVMSQ